MSLLIGDDNPEAVEPHDRETEMPAGGRPGPGEKRRDWAPWRSRRPQSMLIQDAPDPAGDGYGGLDDEAGDDVRGGPPDQGNGFLLDTAGGWDGYPPEPGPPGSYAPGSYPQDRISGDRYPEDRYPESGYADYGDYRAGSRGFRDPGYQEPGHGGFWLSRAGLSGAGLFRYRLPRFPVFRPRPYRFWSPRSWPS